MVEREAAAGAQEEMIAEQAAGRVADQYIAAAGGLFQVARVECSGRVDDP